MAIGSVFNCLLGIALLAMPFYSLEGHDLSNKKESFLFKKMNLSEAEWRKRLTPEQFRVLRQEGTEAPYSSPLNDEHRKGTYVCAGCELPLFRSEAKFDSGTGWPSFYEPIEGHIETKKDWRLLFLRTEYHCARCGGHQGHVFKDGPPPTGLRYCNNGVALKFVLDRK